METVQFDGLAHILALFAAAVGFVGLAFVASSRATPESVRWGTILLIAGSVGLVTAMVISTVVS